MSKFEDEFKNENIVVWDNGGETADRYTVVTEKQYVFGMSGNPFHPQGFSQFAGRIQDWKVYKDFDDFVSTWDKKETRLGIDEIPEEVQKAILDRMEDE